MGSSMAKQLCFMVISWFAAMNSLRAQATPGSGGKDNYDAYDSHFHLTNYIQEGIDVKKLLDVMGTRVGRVALFGIPLQQQWSKRVTGDFAPRYYLDTDAPLYYYSFTDAFIAMAYKSLTKEQQARFDPMITGFNVADMYAAAHIRRVLTTFPGVFTGIGEFTIHKEFVSSKISGFGSSLRDPAVDSIFDFAGEVGLVCIMHSDISNPFPKSYTPSYLNATKDLIRRHPKTTIIWAHCGLGRVIHPIDEQGAALKDILKDPAFNHLYFDISWDEVAKYIVASDASLKIVADLLNSYPDRFLFGTDEVAPADQQSYLKVYNLYAPLWKLLKPETSEKVRKGNYARLFDQARIKVRAWEKINVKQ